MIKTCTISALVKFAVLDTSLQVAVTPLDFGVHVPTTGHLH